MRRVVLPLRLALVLAVVMSLAAKAAYANFHPDGDNAQMGRDIAAIYAERGYRVRIEDRGDLPPIVIARRGRCLVMTRDATYMQAAEFSNQRRMAAAGPINRAFQGHYAAESDRLTLEIYALLKREQARLGMTVRADPVLAVAARDACRPPAVWFAQLKFTIS